MVYDPKRGCTGDLDDGRLLPPEAYPEIPMPACKPPQAEPLKFEQLRAINYLRAIGPFKHDEGLVDWSPAEWSNAMAGEAGEACNLTKKLLRDGADAVDLEELGDEIADVVIYADLVATRLGIKLEDCIRRKFNKVSDKKNSDLRL